MSEIEIEYCAPLRVPDTSRGGRARTARQARPPHRRPAAEARPGGIFQVRVDGELIYDKNADAFDAAEIVRRASERLGHTAGEPVAAGRRWD